MSASLIWMSVGIGLILLWVCVSFFDNNKSKWAFLFPILLVVALVTYSQSPRYAMASTDYQFNQRWQNVVETFYLSNELSNENKSNLGNVSDQQFMMLSYRYLQKHPEDAKVRYQLGMLHLKMHRAKPASQLLRRAMEIDSENLAYRVGYLQSQIVLGPKENVEAVLVMLEQLEKNYPNHEVISMTKEFAMDKLKENQF